MHGLTKGDGPDAAVAEIIRNAGRSFLASTGGVLESLSALSAMQDFCRINKGRAFAYDGLHAAILVTEGKDRTKIFCDKVSDGLYNLRYVKVRCIRG